MFACVRPLVIHYLGAMLTLFVRRLKGQNRMTDVGRTRCLKLLSCYVEGPSFDRQYEVRQWYLVNLRRSGFVDLTQVLYSVIN
jgi:hypothetical protein